MSKKYLIRLKPVDTFFFSTESKYRKKDKGYEADYFQQSAYFPQQTTLLGMLRYYLLLINGQIPITDDSIAKGLIGEKSFDISDVNPDFKTIKNISDVFILDIDNNKYIKNPKDIILKGNKPVRLEPEKLNIKTNFTSGDFIYFPEYKEKEGLSDFLYHSDEKILPFDFDKNYTGNKGNIPNGIFIKHEKIGITKGKSGKTPDNAFYKQITYKLMDEYSFGIVAEFSDEFDVKNTKNFPFVPMGAEKSMFHISFEAINLIKDIKFTANDNLKLILLSDTYIDEPERDDFQFAISNSKTFRFLQTEVVKGNKYYSSNPLENKEKTIKRSGKYNLYERGSVFYFKDEQQMNAFIEKINIDNFNTIGYNKTLKIN